MSKANPDGKVDHLPSEDPNRVEVLIISNIDLQNGGKQSMALFEMFRNGENRVFDARRLEVPGSEHPEKVESPLLKAFVAGYRQAFACSHSE